MHVLCVLEPTNCHVTPALLEIAAHDLWVEVEKARLGTIEHVDLDRCLPR